MAFDGPDGYATGVESLARLVAPRRPLTIAEWAGRYRVLTAKSSAEPGRWRNERVPFVTEIMNALDPRHPASIVVFVGSSQVTKSEMALNWIGRTVHQEPASFLALFPTDKVAHKWVRTRLDGMIAATPELRRLIPLGRRENSGNTLSEKHYPGGVLYTGSANIPDDLASIAVANLLLEEVDRMPIALDDEGDPIELAMRRLSTFTRSKVFMNSTPTTAETSRIWPAWLGSTQDRYFVPCPHCNAFQVLRWANMKWPSGKPRQAAYMCEECAALIEERHKTDMLVNGRWRSTFPEREWEVKGFHVNGMYTPIGLGDSWARHAAAWERSQGSVARIQVFFNTRLGEVHQGARIKVEWKEIQGRAEPFKLRTIPAGVLTLTSGTDVQANRLETQILGWSREERITTIDYVVHRGDVTRQEVWDQLDAYLASEIVNSFGVRMRVSCSMVDSGYLPDVVLNFTRSRKTRAIYASRGSTSHSRIAIGKPSYPDVRRLGKTDNRRFGAERYEIGVSVLKHWLYEVLRSDGGTDEQPVHIGERHIRFSADLDEVYYRQLTAEIWDPKHGWIGDANYHTNEALDTFILARAASMHHTVAVHRMREADYQRLEELYQPSEAVKPTTKPALGQQAIAVMGGFLPTSATTGPTEPP